MLSPSPFRWKHWIKKRETTKWVVLAVLGQSKKSRGNVGNAITATVPPAHKERTTITFCRLTDFGWPRGEGKHYILHKYGQQAREHGRSRFARTAAESETRAATRPLPNVAERDSVRSDYYHLICYYTPDRPLLPPSSINSWSTPCARWLMFLLFIYLLLLLLYIIIIIFFLLLFFFTYSSAERSSAAARRSDYSHVVFPVPAADPLSLPSELSRYLVTHVPSHNKTTSRTCPHGGQRMTVRLQQLS